MAFGVEHGHRFMKMPLTGESNYSGHGFTLAEVIDELADATTEAKCLLTDVGGITFIAHNDGQTRHQESGLARSGDEALPGELRAGREHLGVRPETDSRAAAGFGYPFAGDEARLPSERRVRAFPVENAWYASAERHVVGASGSVDLHIQSRTQRVDDTGTNAVESTGRGVATAAELAASVEFGHHQLHTGQLRFGIDVDRNTAAVVDDCRRAVGVQRHLDLGCVPPKSLIDCVVDDLPQAVHQSPGVSGADVHTRAFAHGIETLKDGQVLGRVPPTHLGAITSGHDRISGYGAHIGTLSTPGGRARTRHACSGGMGR